MEGGQGALDRGTAPVEPQRRQRHKDASGKQNPTSQSTQPSKPWSWSSEGEASGKSNTEEGAEAQQVGL